jgi:hypothetical protein
MYQHICDEAISAPTCLPLRPTLLRQLMRIGWSYTDATLGRSGKHYRAPCVQSEVWTTTSCLPPHRLTAWGRRSFTARGEIRSTPRTCNAQFLHGRCHQTQTRGISHPTAARNNLPRAVTTQGPAMDKLVVSLPRKAWHLESYQTLSNLLWEKSYNRCLSIFRVLVSASASSTAVRTRR